MASITDMVEREREQRAAQITGLREVADFLEQHPELPMPSGLNYMGRHLNSRDELVAAARALGRADKDFSTDYAQIKRTFSGGVALAYQAVREQVCERVVVGTRKVVVEEPDPEQVAALPKVRRIEKVEDVEWRCSPLLDDGGRAA